MMTYKIDFPRRDIILSWRLFIPSLLYRLPSTLCPVEFLDCQASGPKETSQQQQKEIKNNSL